jgi:hypothetical protein
MGFVSGFRSEPEASSLLQELIDSWPLTPALVVGYLSTVLAANRLGQSLSPAHGPDDAACSVAPDV